MRFPIGCVLLLCPLLTAQENDQVQARRLTLRAIRTEPDHFRFKADVPPGAFIDSARAGQIAAEFRNQLENEGYHDASVTPEIVPFRAAAADLILHVRASDPVRVAGIGILGQPGLDPVEIRHAMRSLKGARILPGIPGIWSGWKREPAWTPAALASDLAQVQSLYLSRGYFDASVRLDHTTVRAGKATVHLAVAPGRRYRIRTWKAAGAGIAERLGTGNDLCRCLLDLKRDAEREGIVDFSVRLAVRPATDAPDDVDLVATIHRGRPYRIRRIELSGNRRFSDATIRANLLLNETDPLDTALLRTSLDRLNGSSLFEPLTERSIDLITDHNTGLADVRIRIKERKYGSWLLSGPAGPMSIGGPLQFTLASALPPWGQRLFELSTWYASVSLLTSATPVLALHRPFLKSQSWTSGILIAPQLGWKTSLLRYGSTQFTERSLPWIAGSRSLAEVLPVTVERPTGPTFLFCAPPPPRLRPLRQAATLALRFATSIP